MTSSLKEMLPVRSIAITTSLRDGPESAPISKPLDASELVLFPKSRAWQLSLQLHAGSYGSKKDLATSTFIQCVIGDFTEPTPTNSAVVSTNSTVITADLENSVVVISTSLTGLPPLFAFRDRTQTHFSCPFIPDAARGHLTPDLDGVADTLRWSHPIDGRTLFSDLSVIASSSTITIDKHGQHSIAVRTGGLDAPEYRSLRTEELIAEQLHVFDLSAARILTENAFVSLSGGLDSRTSLVGLLKHGRRLPCVTMSGPDVNLDVRLAKAFCTAHDLEHHTIVLDNEFLRQLPDLVVESAGLTGGVSCLSQTADLYLYKALGPAYAARISGNLGNQVGRGGVESLSAYNPMPEVFSQEVRERLSRRPKIPWFLQRLTDHNYAEVLFGQEVHYWSIPNYLVGSSRALQLTPYCDYRLFQLSTAAFALNSTLRHPTLDTLRSRDLHHRFAGTPKAWSFQRQFLIENDIRGRYVPLNWGWYASGGWSAKWVLNAITSAADAALIKLSRSPSRFGSVAKWITPRLRHPSTLIDWPPTLKGQLRDLTLEAFNSRVVKEAGVFDLTVLESISRDHFSGGSEHHHTMYRCLEISLGLLARASRQKATGQKQEQPQKSK
jgi:hypothetical protein